MWKVKPNFHLPEEYELWEDVDCVYLYKKGSEEPIKTFTHYVLPSELLRTIDREVKQ